MVFVVIVNQRKAPIAVALVKRDGGGVVEAHLKTQVGAVMLDGAGLDTVQQLFTQPSTASFGGNGDGVQARQ